MYLVAITCSTAGAHLAGMVMRARARRYLGLRPIKFRPTHRSERLGNVFLCYTNFEQGDRAVWESMAATSSSADEQDEHTSSSDASE